MKHIIISFFVLLFFNSCKTVTIQNEQHKVTINNIALGSLGIEENFALEKTYNPIGIINYSIPIKVNATINSFEKPTYKAFLRAKEMQNTQMESIEIDSVKMDSRFVTLEISDKIQLIDILNNKANSIIKAYFKNQNNSHIVTHVSMLFSKIDTQDMVNADEIFIEMEGIKSGVLKLYNNGVQTKVLNFNDGLVFTYRVSSACWKENEKHQLEIVDLVEGDNGCSFKSYKSARRAKKKINYYNY